MSALELTHLLLIGLWGGVVAAETVVEFAVRTEEEQRFSATLHYWIDLLIELPVLCGVLLTGGLLAARVWPPTPLLLFKMGCGLVAVGVNVYCVGLVVARHRRAADPAELARLNRRVKGAWVGVPVGVAAFVIGIGWFVG